MDWDDLRFFLAVARAGQLKGAAMRLSVDATTVSRRIRRLELALGQILFEQSREGQVLSEAGELLLLNAEEVERAMARIDVATAEGSSISGLIRISVSEGFGTWFVARELPSFFALHPDVRVDLVATSGFLSPSKRETDVAILLARPATGPLISKKLADYSLRVYASRQYLANIGRTVIRPADLCRHDLVGYVPDLIYAPELRYLDEVFPGLSPKVRSTSINAQHRLVAAGAGIGILPSFIGESDESLVRLLPEVEIRRSFWLVTHQDTRRLRRIEAFVQWLENAIGRLLVKSSIP